MKPLLAMLKLYSLSIAPQQKYLALQNGDSIDDNDKGVFQKIVVYLYLSVYVIPFLTAYVM